MTGNDQNKRSGFMQSLTGVVKQSRPKLDDQDELGNKKRPAVTGKKKLLGVWLDPAATRQFNALAGELGMQKQALMAEALNLLFAKYHKPTIA